MSANRYVPLTILPHPHVVDNAAQIDQVAAQFQEQFGGDSHSADSRPGASASMARGHSPLRRAPLVPAPVIWDTPHIPAPGQDGTPARFFNRSNGRAVRLSTVPLGDMPPASTRTSLLELN